MTRSIRWTFMTVGTLLLGLAAISLHSFEGRITLPEVSPDLREAGFVLSEVGITGLERTPRGAIIALIDADTGSPILSIDLAALKGRIESLPWVAEAHIKRRLPSGLDIAVVEREAFAIWQQDGALSLIDASGAVIDGAPLGEFTHLPLVVGDGSQKRAAIFLDHLMRAPQLGKRVKSLVRVADRRWDIVFDNGLRLKLPAPGVDDADRRAWAEFVTLQDDKQILERAIDAVDMRVEDRLVIRLSPDAGARLKRKGDMT